MLNPPKTLREAQIYIYGKWAGNLLGQSYEEGYCAYRVLLKFGNCQCQRRNGYGPNMLYCKQHAKILLEEGNI